MAEVGPRAPVQGEDFGTPNASLSGAFQKQTIAPSQGCPVPGSPGRLLPILLSPLCRPRWGRPQGSAWFPGVLASSTGEQLRCLLPSACRVGGAVREGPRTPPPSPPKQGVGPPAPSWSSSSTTDVGVWEGGQTHRGHRGNKSSLAQHLQARGRPLTAADPPPRPSDKTPIVAAK